MTFREKFDELKAKYGTVDESKLTEPFAIQVNMTEDESAGTFYVAFVNGVFSVEPYDYRDHTSMITLSVANLEAILAKKADPVQLFLNGALQVEGSVDHALMLVDLMAKEEKKPAAKKAAAKKRRKKNTRLLRKRKPKRKRRRRKPLKRKRKRPRLPKRKRKHLRPLKRKQKRPRPPIRKRQSPKKPKRQKNPPQKQANKLR